MKKTYAMVLMLFVLLCSCILIGCGKSEAVKAVEALIAEIGTVDASSETAILKAETAFNALSPKEQNKVENYNLLLKARIDFNAIPKETVLTSDNIKDYLSFEISYDPVSTETVGGVLVFGRTTLHLTAVPTKPGSFSNASVEIKIPCPGMWTVSSDYPEYNKDNMYEISMKVTIPVNGSFSKSVPLVALNVYSIESSDYNLNLRFSNVKGVFIEN
ncbi:MAG: hypothetical protein J6Z38_07805 [Lachnospiraceae bacterium]|nr:hypothetical protein [Lachnospiraceae bacterium]